MRSCSGSARIGTAPFLTTIDVDALFALSGVSGRKQLRVLRDVLTVDVMVGELPGWIV